MITLDTVVCPPLSLTDGTISYSDPTLGVNSVATHSCDQGYVIAGTSTRTCQTDGRWTGGSSNCASRGEYIISFRYSKVYICFHSDILLACPTLSPLSNGHINRTKGSFPGSIATYACNSGYQLNGTNERRCENGQWTGVKIVCRGELK